MLNVINPYIKNQTHHKSIVNKPAMIILVKFFVNIAYMMAEKSPGKIMKKIKVFETY